MVQSNIKNPTPGIIALLKAVFKFIQIIANFDKLDMVEKDGIRQFKSPQPDFLITEGIDYNSFFEAIFAAVVDMLEIRSQYEE